MTKSDIIEQVAKNTGTAIIHTKPVVDEVFNAITKNIAAGRTVSISGFGVFSNGMSPRRVLRHPLTRELMEIEPKPTPSFRPGRKFKAAVRAKRRK